MILFPKSSNCWEKLKISPFPVETPTVPNAETTSNKIFKKGKFCVSTNTKVVKRTRKDEKIIIANALFMTFCSIVLLKIF